MRTAPAIQISAEDRAIIERWARGRSTPARLVLRAKIVLASAAGASNKDIAEQLRCGVKTVALWRGRYAAGGVARIEKDAPRGGRTKKSEMLTQLIMHKTLHESPPRRRRWSTRLLAATMGISPAMVQRVWKSQGINPQSATAVSPDNRPSG